MRFLLIISLLLLGCTETELLFFDGQRASQEVQMLLARGPRDAGTPGALRAAEHLRGRLETHGVFAELDSFAEPAPPGKLTFHNVIGLLPGKEGGGVIVLAAHYDTKSGMPPGFQGANDSGSGCGVLLELARVLAGQPLKHEILFAFFDGEECIRRYGKHDGLHGSQRLMRQLVESGEAKRVKAVIVLDMIGDADLNITIPANSTPELVERVFAAARAAGHRKVFSFYGGEILDDHDPFFQVGIPAIDLIDFCFGSAPGRNDYWHTENDTLEHISAESLNMVGETVLKLIEGFNNE